VGASEPRMGFGKASVACVDLPELRPKSGQLVWFHSQKQLREFAKQDALG